MPPTISTRAFHAMAKPSGADCNLRCTYCFYLEKKALYEHAPRPRMSDTLLEAYVRDYIASIDEDVVFFLIRRAPRSALWAYAAVCR
mgnify:CR=1 FL=1